MIPWEKKLCEVTLAEYIAAERSVGILSGWVVGIATALFLFLLRLGWLRYQARKYARAFPAAPPVTTAPPSATLDV